LLPGVKSKLLFFPAVIVKLSTEFFLLLIKQIGERSKQIFMITDKGKKILSNAKKQGRQMEENFLKFRKLISEIGEFKNEDIVELMYNIRILSVSKSKIKNVEVRNILEKCVNELKKI